VQTATIKTEVITFNHWTLRVRQSTIENPKVLVMIHGITGDESSMWVFGRKFSTSYLILAPRAPFPAQPSGYSWRDVDKYPLQSDFGYPAVHMLKSSADDLIQLIDQYTTSLKIEAQRFDVVGFSQGGAMVNVLGMTYPHRINKMAVLAAFVPSGLDEYIQNKSLTGKNVFVAHGTKDETVSIERAHASIDMLRQAGANVNFVEDEVGHKLGANGMKALEEYLQY
jgi:phospholipase/carboxylesterase